MTVEGIYGILVALDNLLASAEGMDVRDGELVINGLLFNEGKSRRQRNYYSS